MGSTYNEFLMPLRSHHLEDFQCHRNEVNYQNNWSGQFNNEDLPEGSYYYLIDFNRSGNPDYQGIVYLAR